MNSCASAEAFKQLLKGALPKEQEIGLWAHLAGCGPCQVHLDQLIDKPEWKRWAAVCWPHQADSTGSSFQRAMEPALAGLLERLHATPAPEAFGAADTAEEMDLTLGFLAPPQDPGDLGTLGPYRVRAELGRGGMGIVLRAYDPELRRTVALKVLPPDRADARARARFVREARAAASLTDDHVVPVYAVDNPPYGPPYLVMQYVEGMTLRERIRAEGRMDPCEAARICRQAARGLAAAHRAGLVHRDIKPSNIILERGSKRARIMDFGLVRMTELPGGLTQEGIVAGTPEYMSPEQVRTPERIDARTDVYGLGVTLYEALTGEVPFRGVQQMVLQQTLTDEPRSPRRLNDQIPRDLETICLRCLQKEPGQRYGTAEALAEDLDRFLAGEPIQARPVRAWERAVKWARRRPAIAALLAVVFIVGAAGFGLVTWQWREAAAARHEVAEQAETLQANLYYTLIGLAERELKRRIGSRADELLDQCPPHLRGWEWHYLKRFPLAHFPTLRHETLVIRVAFSPDGRHLASGDLDGNVTVWDARTGDEVRILRAHDRRVWALAFSPEGQYLATGGREDRRVKVWDVSTGQLLHDLANHTDGIQGLVFSPDGKRLGSASVDRTVRLWDLSSGQEVLIFREHSQPLAINGLAFGADGQRLISVSVDGVVKVWDAVTGKTVATFQGDIGWLGSAAFTSDGRWLALGGENGTVKAYRTDPWQEVRTLEAHACEVHYLAFSPDGRRLASTAEWKTLKLWDVLTGHEALVLDIHAKKISSLAFSPDGHRLVSGSADYTVKVSDGSPWVDFQTGKRGGLTPRWTWTAHDHKVVEVVFSPDSQRLISASWDGTVKFWDLSPGEPGVSAPRLMLTVPGLPADLTGVALSRDGRRCAASSLDGTVTICDAHSGENIGTLRAEAGPVYGVAFHPFTHALASVHYNGTVNVWDIECARARGVNSLILSFPAHSDAVREVAYSADGRLLASAGGRDQETNVGIWEAATGKPIHRLYSKTFIKSVAFSHDSRRLASTGGSHELVLWDLATGEALRSIRFGDRNFRAVFSPDGRRLAAACEGQTVRLWDLATDQELVTLQTSGGQLWNVAFSPDGRYLATCSGYKGNGTIQLWDTSGLNE
jgi:WD40 repeat protein